MKRIVLASLLATVFMSCQMSKDSGDSGITLVTNGFNTKAHYLSLGDGKISSKEFTIGTKVYYILEGVTGFVLKDGKVFPGTSITVTDKDKKVIESVDDLFSDYADGIDPAEITNELELYVTMNNLMEEGKDYDWHLRIWDKNGKAEMSADIPFKIVAPKDLIGIKTTATGLNCPRIYILANGPLLNNKVKEGHELDFVFSGMEGFQLQADSTVSLGTSMVVKNKDGKVMAEFADLFSEIGPVNVTRVSLVKAELTIRSFPPGIYTWSVRIWDKNSTNAIESLAELDVQL